MLAVATLAFALQVTVRWALTRGRTAAAPRDSLAVVIEERVATGISGHLAGYR